MKRLGDGLPIAFRSPTHAVKAALAMHADAARARVRLRVGIHIGEPLSRDGDLIVRGARSAMRAAMLSRAGARNRARGRRRAPREHPKGTPARHRRHQPIPL